MSNDLTLIETLPAPFPDVFGVFSYWSKNDLASVEVQFQRILYFGLYQPPGCAEVCDPDSPPEMVPFLPSLIDDGSYAPAFSKKIVEAANYRYLGVCDSWNKDKAAWREKAEAAFTKATEKSSSNNQGQSN